MREAEDVEIAVVALAALAIVVAISILWVRAIDRQMDDPEWQEHKDDPDYWDWP